MAVLQPLRKVQKRETDPVMTGFNPRGGINSLRDIFNSAFTSNDVGDETINQIGQNSLATNLTEANNGIALQSSLFDTVIALQQQQRPTNMFDFFTSNTGNFGNSSGNSDQGQSVVSDDLISDLSRRVNNLSMTERQEAQNDLYGFRLRQQSEDPLELKIWMHEIDDMIRKGISGKDSRFSAIQVAWHTQGGDNEMSGQEYLQSLYLVFLRSADFSVTEAVLRIALFFTLKLEYFGSECLIRDLTIKDLTPEDIRHWKGDGFLQLSAERDAYGRAIMVLFGKDQLARPISTVVRCILYLSTIMIRDETIQRDGYLFLFWGHGQDIVLDGRARILLHAYRAVPIRGIGRHLCYDKFGLQACFPIIAQMAQAKQTMRTKIHNGTPMECLYNLMTYGIPRNAIPITNDGEIEITFHVSFLDAIERKEAESQNSQRQKPFSRQSMLLNARRAHENPNSSSSNNNNTSIGSQAGEGVSVGRGEPYQREPPEIPRTWEDCSRGIQRSSIMSLQDPSDELRRSSIGSVHGAFDLQSEEFDALPDDFMNRLSQISNNPGMQGASSRTPIEAPQVPSSTLEPTPLAEPDNRMQNTVPGANGQISRSTDSSPPQETGEKKSDFIIAPGMFDVIMGRGRHNKKKPGNQKLNKLLEQYQERYEQGDKFSKTVLAEVVVSKMIADGSRFLMREGQGKKGVWKEVSVDKARDKVAHDFRNLRRFAKKNADNASIEAGTAPNSNKRSINLVDIQGG